MSRPKRTPLAFAALLAASFFWSGPLSHGQNKDKDKVHILWIGNSLTYVNELPSMVAELAKAGKQHAMIHEEVTRGGATLEIHWKDHKALKKIQAHKWDYVVLSDQHRECLKPSSKMSEYAKDFEVEIHKHGGKTLLYLPWPPADVPETQAKLTKLHLDLAKSLKATVVPAGPAWEKLLGEAKPPKLYKGDNVHPTPAGTYLAACVFYATIYNKSPVGLPGNIGGLSDKDAHHFQEIAWQVASDFSKKK